MNKKAGMYSALLTLAAVLGFAFSMIIGSNFGSYLSSLFISWGFVPMICAFAATGENREKALSYTAVVFAAVYTVLIGVVYFAQLTTVRLSDLNEQALALLDYRNLGSLFFNYDLFGYAFMALSTFFTGLTIKISSKSDRWLKALLLIHGIFAISGILMPIFGVFNTGMGGGGDATEISNIIGVIILEFWCAYFCTVCILAYNYFKKPEQVK